MHPVLGSLSAVCSALLVGTGIVLQAAAARRVASSHAFRPTMLLQLARSSTWLIAVGCGLGGWGLHILALRLAPLTIVQPALASSLVVVLVLSARVLHDRVSRRDVAGVVVLSLGIGALLASAPPAGHHQAAIAPLALCVAVLTAVALLPMLTRRPAGAWAAVAVAPGAAFALCNIATKLFTDRLGGSQHAAIAGWLALVGGSAALGTITETSAFQTLPAPRVVGIVFATETIVPVVLAPSLFGERWASGSPAEVGLRLAALAAVTAAIVLLATSRIVAGAVARRW
jgi:drug/metabolite transporter (DMT)-like permease